MSRGTDRDIVEDWPRLLNLTTALLEDLNNYLFWPYITDAPEDTSVAVGDTCTFTVTASNVTSYQWRVATPDVGWTDIPGATNASYSFIVTNEDYDNFYQCRMVGKIQTAIINTDMVTVLPLTT